jgi:hypothetical protein
MKKLTLNTTATSGCGCQNSCTANIAKRVVFLQRPRYVQAFLQGRVTNATRTLARTNKERGAPFIPETGRSRVVSERIGAARRLDGSLLFAWVWWNIYSTDLRTSMSRRKYVNPSRPRVPSTPRKSVVRREVRQTG